MDEKRFTELESKIDILDTKIDLLSDRVAQAIVMFENTTKYLRDLSALYCDVPSMYVRRVEYEAVLSELTVLRDVVKHHSELLATR